jgi:3-oxoadipate enol-lactonase
MNTATGNPTLHFTAGDGTRIAYRWDGPQDAPVLVLANSIATNLHMWDSTVPALAAHFRVLRYDFRGHGQSDAPAGDYSLDRLGRDVLELLDGLQVQRAHFLGLSLGGYVGQWLAIHAPKRIDRLILSNTSSMLGPAGYFDARIAELRGTPDMEANARGFLANWFPARMLQTPDDVVEDFRAMVVTTPPQGLAGAFAAVRDADLRRTVSLIERPTLVIAGRDDKVTDASQSERIAAAVPGARLLVLPTVHLPNIEQPEVFEQAVLDFLSIKQAA